MLAPVPVSIEYSFISSVEFLLIWMSILRLAVCLPVNLPSSEALLVPALETLGVFIFPGVATSRWKKGFKGVCDQGVEAYSFLWTLLHYHFLESDERLSTIKFLALIKDMAIL